MQTQVRRAPRSALVTAVVAVVVTVGAIGAVVLWKPKPDGAPSAPPAATPDASAPEAATCGDGPCQEVAAVTVGPTPVVLLADAGGKAGRIRVGQAPGTLFDLTINQLGVKLAKDSLRCVDGSTAACLVRGEVAGGAYGELLASHAGRWTDPVKPYYADTGTITLDDVNADGIPDVVVVRHDCPGETSGTPKCQAAPVLAEVYDLTGVSMGCTRRVTSPSLLRGWPDIHLMRSDLRTCPAE